MPMLSSVNFGAGAGAALSSVRHAPPCSAGGGSPSYLDMWKKAMARDRRSQVLRHITLPPSAVEVEEKERTQSLEQKTEVFNKILEVPKEERDRIQLMQVIDRASAAIAAARALIKESPAKTKQSDGGALN